ncbi:MAG: phosphate-starvation-inducible PsiE family protein, partial [Myxococcaceae bacterium]|nr:phosphate-starvation-inducible PsiE family protein [Myxococcaceae bacterium]
MKPPDWKDAPSTAWVGRLLGRFEHGVVLVLILLLMGVIALSTLDLAWRLIHDVITPPVLLLDVQELLELFGFFLLILIGLELLETIRAYLNTHVI